MARIILHIGTHKTGTTHLQNLFLRNQALLLEHGVIYPQIGIRAGQHPLAAVWNSFMQPAKGHFDARSAWQDLIGAHATGDQTLLLSSEEFSRVSARGVDMAELAQWLRPFDEVLILCTLRNQAAFLQSVYQEIIVQRPPLDWDKFLAHCLKRLRCDGLSLDYDHLLSHIARGFAPSQIRFVCYETARQAPGGLLGQYLALMGLDIAPERFAPVPKSASNISPQPLASFSATQTARPEAPPEGLIRMMQDSLDRRFGAGKRTTLFTRKELTQIARATRPSNQAFLRRVRAQQPDFQLAPVSVGTVDLWREDLDAAFWAESCRALIGLQP